MIFPIMLTVVNAPGFVVWSPPPVLYVTREVTHERVRFTGRLRSPLPERERPPDSNAKSRREERSQMVM